MVAACVPVEDFTAALVMRDAAAIEWREEFGLPIQLQVVQVGPVIRGVRLPAGRAVRSPVIPATVGAVLRTEPPSVRQQRAPTARTVTTTITITAAATTPTDNGFARTNIRTDPHVERRPLQRAVARFS